MGTIVIPIWKKKKLVPLGYSLNNIKILVGIGT